MRKKWLSVMGLAFGVWSLAFGVWRLDRKPLQLYFMSNKFNQDVYVCNINNSVAFGQKS